MPEANAIEARGLTKDYGSGRGIFDLDLAVAEGEAFGFLGPNGAGKTTTIKLLMGMTHATKGSASIFALDVDRDAVALKHRIGYVPGELPQWGGWRGAEIVAYLAGIRGDMLDDDITRVATQLELDLSRRYREYSHGNKQKLALLIAFSPRPALLILDEPTSGLDPLHQQAFYALVRDARAGGATIFVSSHVLSEVEQLCDRVAIVREGRLVTVGRIDELTGMRAQRIEIELSDAAGARQLASLAGLEQVQLAGTHLSGMYRGDVQSLLATLASLRVVSFTSREPSLEEVFLTYYAGKRE